MPAIGYVTKQANGGYKGQLKTLSIRAEIDLVPNTGKTAENQPDFRVLTKCYEIGAGWVRRGETSGQLRPSQMWPPKCPMRRRREPRHDGCFKFRADDA